MSQRIPNIQCVFKATDPLAGDVFIVGIIPGTGSFAGDDIIEDRLEIDGPSGVNNLTPPVTVTPSFTVT